MGTAVVASGGKALPALPAHIAAAVAKLDKPANDIVRSGLGSGFVAPPEISPRGGKIRLKLDGEEILMTKKNEDGEDEPRSSINVVIIDANKGKHKAYYSKQYSDDAEPTAPDCYSYDGEKPSPYAQAPQSETCASCKRNIFGSKITEQGKKSRECSDNKILAVMAAEGVRSHADADSLAGTVFRVKVSPTALNRNKQDRKDNPQDNTSLLEYVTLLDNYPVATNGGGTTVAVPVRNVVTRLFLARNTDYPTWRFRLGGFLEAEDIAYIEERAKGDDVQAIITDQGGPVVIDNDLEEFETPKQVATQPALPPAIESIQPALPARAAKVIDPDDDDDLPPAPPPPRKRTARPAAVAAPAASQPAPAVAAKPATKAAVADPDDDDPPVATTSTRIDQELAEIGALFK